VEVESCVGSGKTGAGTPLFPGPRTSFTARGVNLQVSGSRQLFAVVRFQFCCSLANHIAAPTERTTGEVLEPAYF
jgi:hypothetical protein